MLRQAYIIGCLCIASLLSSPLIGQPTPLVPEANTLQSGDLLWPKKPGKFVPYDSTTEEDYDAKRHQWLTEKAAYIQRVRNTPNSGPHALQWATDLEQMTFEEFLRIYEGDHGEDYIVRFGGESPLYVGHVGIVLIESGSPFIVEAVMGKGVIRSSYADWLAGRPGELVWHGRIKGATEQDRAKIATVAASFIGKPYNFWNFDLADENGFYCSKLAWLSILRGANVVADDDPSTQRFLWYSPKKLMKSKHLDLLLTHGSYAID
jgi:hypothetical protein